MERMLMRALARLQKSRKTHLFRLDRFFLLVHGKQSISSGKVEFDTFREDIFKGNRNLRLCPEGKWPEGLGHRAFRHKRDFVLASYVRTQGYVTILAADLSRFKGHFEGDLGPVRWRLRRGNRLFMHKLRRGAFDDEVGLLPCVGSDANCLGLRASKRRGEGNDWFWISEFRSE